MPTIIRFKGTFNSVNYHSVFILVQSTGSLHGGGAQQMTVCCEQVEGMPLAETLQDEMLSCVAQTVQRSRTCRLNSWLSFIISDSPGNTSHRGVIYTRMSAERTRGGLKDTFSGMFWDAASTRLDSVIWLLLHRCSSLRWSKRQTVRSFGQSDTNIHFYTMQRSFFFY